MDVRNAKELVELGQRELVEREAEHAQRLLREDWLGAGAQRVDDVDDQAVGGGAHGDGSRAHQEGDNVEEVGQVARHVEAVVEGEHEKITGQVSYIVPHNVLLQLAGRRDAGLVDDTTQPPDHLKFTQLIFKIITKNTSSI